MVCPVASVYLLPWRHFHYHILANRYNSWFHHRRMYSRSQSWVVRLLDKAETVL
jgi:hypothetical protein